MDRTLRLGTHIQGLLSFLSSLSGKRHVLVALLIALLRLAVPAPARSMSQRTGDFELEMDAPWRIEPRGGSIPAYGAIPIQVSIHDADQPATGADAMLQQIITVMQGYTDDRGDLRVSRGSDRRDFWPDQTRSSNGSGSRSCPTTSYRRSSSSTASNRSSSTRRSTATSCEQHTFTLATSTRSRRRSGSGHIARRSRDPRQAASPPARPNHSLCRRWQGQDCSSFAALRPTSEWHMTALYTPTSPTPGRDVRLRTVLRRSRRFATGSPRSRATSAS